MIPAEELLTGVRWEILRALAEGGETSATELAKRAGTTLPSVSQAMKLLEAYGYVNVKRKKREGPGKPTHNYSLKKGVLNITYCREGFARKETLQLDSFEETMLNLLFVPKKDRQWLAQLLCVHGEIRDLANAIAYVDGDDKEIHLLVIAEDLDEFRKKHSNIILKEKTEQRKIVCWSHNEQEVLDGLERKEKYFTDLFKSPFAIYDPGNIIQRIRGGR